MGKIFYYRRKKGDIILDRTMMRWCDRLELITFYISDDVPRGKLRDAASTHSHTGGTRRSRRK